MTKIEFYQVCEDLENNKSIKVRFTNDSGELSCSPLAHCIGRIGTIIGTPFTNFDLLIQFEDKREVDIVNNTTGICNQYRIWYRDLELI